MGCKCDRDREDCRKLPCDIQTTRKYEGDSDRVLLLYISTTSENAHTLLTSGHFSHNENAPFGSSGIYFTPHPDPTEPGQITAFVLVGKSLLASTSLPHLTYDIITKDYQCDSVKGRVDSQEVYVVYRWTQVWVGEIKVKNRVMFASGVEPNDVETAKREINKRFERPSFSHLE